MRAGNIFVAIGLTGAILALSAGGASARWYHRPYVYHRGPGPVLGLVGGIVVGAATIATLPFAILGGAARSAPPPDYYGPPGQGYGPPGQGYGPPPEAYAPPPPRPYYYGPRGYYGPPPGYYGY
jgi:hypothetical protein